MRNALPFFDAPFKPHYTIIDILSKGVFTDANN